MFRCHVHHRLAIIWLTILVLHLTVSTSRSYLVSSHEGTFRIRYMLVLLLFLFNALSPFSVAYVTDIEDRDDGETNPYHVDSTFIFGLTNVSAIIIVIVAVHVAFGVLT